MPWMQSACYPLSLAGLRKYLLPTHTYSSYFQHWFYGKEQEWFARGPLSYSCVGPTEGDGTVQAGHSLAFSCQRERERTEPQVILRHWDDWANVQTLLLAQTRGNPASASSSSEGLDMATCCLVPAGAAHRQAWRWATCRAVCINISEILEHLVFQISSTRRAVVYQCVQIIILCGSSCSWRFPFIS